MRLYYQTSYETATGFILPERRMRLSRFHRLNDPFELRSVKLEGGRPARRAFNALMQHWDNRLGVICMGKHWRSPVMWAHYANNHSGVCLGFDVPDDKAHPISYVPDRQLLRLNPKLPLGGVTEELLFKMLTTKYEHWRYEEEWRVWSNLDEPDPGNGEFYVDFGPSLELREIIIGARCKRSASDFDRVLGKVDQPIEIIKARAAFETFTMVQQQQFKPVKIMPRPA
jgi:hypothetical protein